MFARTLAKIVSVLPTSFKYKLKKIKGIYTLVMKLGQPVIEIQTAAGKFYWKINNLTSQKFILGTYEPYMQKAFQEFIHPGFIVYDVGAHIGFHTLFCGLIARPSGQVIAFEPNPKNYESLKRQISINSKLSIKVFSYALSNVCGQVKIDTSIGSSQSQIAESGDIMVEARTMDYLTKENIIPPPNLIKIDVEGHEKQVIMGALDTLRKYKPIILIDYNDDKTLDVVVTLLEPLGYSINSGPPITAIPNKSY